jgi:hypothetical protein
MMKAQKISLLVLALLCVAAPAAARRDAGHRLAWDDFHEGWLADDAPGARWFTFSFGDFVADDGIPTTSCRGLEVVPKGTNPLTGEPAFTSTMGHETGALGTFDRVKWLAVMNHFSSAGFLGFDAEAGKELVCEARMSGQVFGAEGHPFGAAVTDPAADPRLGTVVASAFDPETYLIFNFLLTNEVLYAFYERAPFLRTPTDDYAAFLYAVPVLPRDPADVHDLQIAYDRARGRVRWLVDGVEVFRVNTLGARIDRRFMLVDRGGANEIVAPRQLDCALGTFTFLDGYGPLDEGLVQLDAPGEPYFHPLSGEPRTLDFLDPSSAPESRLFGQGATLKVHRVVVTSRPSHDG